MTIYLNGIVKFPNTVTRKDAQWSRFCMPKEKTYVSNLNNVAESIEFALHYLFSMVVIIGRTHRLL